MERAVSFPLRRKLGLFALCSLALLAIVCAVGVHQLLGSRRDGARLLEEARELALNNDLDAHIESIELLLEFVGRGEASSDARGFVLTQIADVRAILAAIGRAPGEDPSRLAHEAEEQELLRSLDSRLAALADELEHGIVEPPSERALDLAAMRELGARLEQEASEEATFAEHDLRERSSRAVVVMLVTVALAMLALVAMVLVVLRTVVRPLRTLEGRALALGRGDFRPGPGVESDDEIGALAQAFDDMARKIAAHRDVLEGRVAEKTRELVRAARYADLGVLAAGVAHEINNPLATIAACAEGMQRRLERGALDRREQEEYYETIASEAYRARDITQRLLTLARQDPAPATPIALSRLLPELARVTRHQLEQRGSQLVIEAPPGMLVSGNEGELLQALVNLVLNARDASPPGATVRVTAARRDGFAVIDVDDEGPGVPADLMERIFEPFFTTKPSGEGTGLGLSLVAAIVENHGGSIVVARSPRGGARFRVRVPLSAEAKGVGA